MYHTGSAPQPIALPSPARHPPPTTPTELDDTATPLPNGATITVSPTIATPFQIVTVTGARFGEEDPIVLYWDSLKTRPVGVTTASLLGAFTTRIKIPHAVAGPHTLIAVGAVSQRYATATVQVRPLMTLQPATGRAGSHVTAQGFGYGALEPVKVVWNTSAGQVLGMATSNAVGSFVGSTAITFTVPVNAPGSYPVYGLGQQGHATGAVFTITP